MEEVGNMRAGQEVGKIAGDWSTVGRGEPLASDQCSASPTFSFPRFVLFTLVFLAMLPGGLILFLLLSDRPYGLQLASAIAYTAAIVLYTFSKNKSLQRYLFRCPYVRLVLPQLALRHFGFLIALVVLETEALRIRPHLSAFWLTGWGSSTNMPPFVVALFALCGCLALAQIISNRAILRRAHVEGAPDPNGEVPFSH